MLDELILRYNELRSFLTRRLGCPHDASDALQELAVRFGATEHHFDGIADREAYLFRAARNIAQDMHRARHRRQVREASAAFLGFKTEPAAGGEERALATQQLRLVKRALDELPERQRRALLMSRLGGRTFRDIAAELGVSESMVAKYIAAALRHCRDRLEDG
ncbi:MAG: sigma-70 family RNA polymerase sigma factor [Pseudomonadota bacterium]